MYRQQMKDMICKQVSRDPPLQGLKVVVNAGNGSGGFVADMLREVGGWVRKSPVHDIVMAQAARVGQSLEQIRFGVICLQNRVDK